MLETQRFAIAMIMKSWEVFLLTGICMNESLSNSRQFKIALMDHLEQYVDDSFKKLKGRECYNSFVGALTQTGIVTPNLVKEIYTADELQFLNEEDIDEVHVIKTSDEDLRPW